MIVRLSRSAKSVAIPTLMGMASTVAGGSCGDSYQGCFLFTHSVFLLFPLDYQFG